MASLANKGLDVSLSKFINHIETLVLYPGIEVKNLDLINKNFLQKIISHVRKRS